MVFPHNFLEVEMAETDDWGSAPRPLQWGWTFKDVEGEGRDHTGSILGIAGVIAWLTPDTLTAYECVQQALDAERNGTAKLWRNY